jgi:hypothetical protein
MFRSQKRLRKPITRDILQQITSFTVLTKRSANLRAAYLIGYAGFLRAGEFCYEAKHLEDMTAFNASRLCRRDVHFSNDGSNMAITLRASKTDIRHEGVKIYISANVENPVFCPVTAMKMLFQIDNNPNDPHGSRPLFNLDGLCFSRAKFVKDMADRLTACGIDSTGFTGHSIRRGAAQDASDNGLLDSEIKILGRWTSESFRLYFKISASKRFELNRQFQCGVVQDRGQWNDHP